MRVGISTLFCIGERFSDVVERLRTIDVEHLEVVDEWPHEFNDFRVNLIRRIVEERGLSLSIHAPFADVNIASTSPTMRNTALRRLKKSMKLSAKLNPTIWVFHSGVRSPIGSMLPNMDWKFNLNSIRELLHEARKYDLKIAIENFPESSTLLVREVEDFEKLYEDLGVDALDLGIAFDVGHANIGGYIDKFMEKFKEKIIHVHVHDNDGKVDSHLGIGFGSINWVKVLNSLKKMNYRGVLVIESISNVKGSIEKMRKLIEH
jgi:sugar phosphate isomerase/epimerase